MEKAEQFLKRLKEGNVRFEEGRLEHPHMKTDWRKKIAHHGQKPFAAILACADSREPVEMLFDRGFGDLFVIRVAGAVAGPTVVASVEFAVDHLEVPLFVVLGHTHCGAVTAAVKSARADGPMAELLDRIQPAVLRMREKLPPNATETDLVEAAAYENVWLAIEDLTRKDSVFRDRLRDGKLKAVGAVYDIEKSRVVWLGDHPNQKALCGG